MKTILLISRCPPYPLHFGDRLILWHLTRALAQRGHVLDLLALYDRDDDPGQIEQYRAYFRHVELIREPKRSGLAYLRRIVEPARRFATGPESSFCPQLWRLIDGFLKHNSYDLAHCFGAVSVYEYYPLLADLPTVITPYESHSLYLQSAARQGDPRARLRLPLARRFERFMFTPYDRTVVIAEADATMLYTLQPALNIDVIPIGLDLGPYPLVDAPREPSTLLFVGNFAYPPNQDAARTLVHEILPAVRQAIPGARLQLVGVNPPEWLRALASDQVEVTGAVPDVTPYLARASVFVCPLRIGAGLKNKVLEALAAGIPLVGTPLSVDGIVVRDGESALVAPVERIAAQTISLLRDEALRQRLSRKGRQLVEDRYSADWSAARYEALYDEICAG